MSTVRQIAIVFRKELRDGLRDRRSIMSVVLGAALTPALFGGMFTVMATRAKNAEDIRLPVVGGENAPAFVDWLKQQSGVEIVAPPSDAEKAVRDRTEDVVLVIDKDFSKNMQRALPAPVKLVSDSTRDTSRAKVKRVRSLVTTYSSQVAALRLIARGVAPALAQPVRLEDVEVSSAQERLAALLNILTFLLVIVSLTGGMQVAIDTTAGERERGSLEPLLLNPVSRVALAGGKWLAAVAFACSAMVFSLLLTVNVLRRVPWQDMGIRFRVSDVDLMSLLLLVMPLAFLLSAVLIFASTFARSFKEAQGYIGMLILVPLLPGMIAMLYPLSNRRWLAPVPLFGQYALAADILGGKPPGIIFYVLAGLSALIFALVLVGLTSRLLKREAIIFGR